MDLTVTWGNLMAIQKPLVEDRKVINFSRGLANKHKTLHTVMLGKPRYPTLCQFVIALRGFHMSEEGDKQMTQPTHDPTIAFVSQNTHGRGR